MNPPSRLRELDPDDDGPFVETPAPSERKRKLWIALAVLGLTALGGVFRFVRLDRPPVWGDEASTWRRVSGTYGQMLQTLERDPFTPLFYSFEWALRNWADVHLTPFWLRLLPAIAGTLMVSAMYFLARQVASVRTSLVVTILTCCSSWLINYSRDAKMYMTFWLFVALCAGSFLWWLRRRSWTAWLCWIAAGCAMMGLNVWGAVLLALMPVWLLTARRVHWLMGIGFVVGAGVISTGVVGYYTLFNNYVDKASDRGSYQGISWVDDRNEGATGLDLIRDSAASYLYSFTFLQEDHRLEPPRGVLIGAVVAMTVIVSLAVLGLMPWRKPTDKPGADSSEPWWRSTFWVGLWLIVPTYGFYCMSISQPQSPRDWWWQLHDLLGGYPLLFIFAIAIAAVLVSCWKSAAKWLAVAALAVVGIALLYAVYKAWTLDVPPEHRWYWPIDAVDRWVRILADPRLLWPLIVVVPGIAIARSGTKWTHRLGHTLALLLIVAATAMLLQYLYRGAESAKAEMQRGGMKLTSMWVPRYLGFIWPAMAIAVAAMLVRLPTRPLRWSAITALAALNLFVAWHRVFDHTEPPLDRVWADVQAGSQFGDTTRTFIPPVRGAGAGPGAGHWQNLTGYYYLLHNRDDLEFTPASLVRTDVRRWLVVYPFDNPDTIASRVRRSSHVKRVIVWKPDFPPGRGRPRPAGPENVLEKLGPGWTLKSEEFIPVRYHWCWATRYVYIRREYVKS